MFFDGKICVHVFFGNYSVTFWSEIVFTSAIIFI